MREIPATKLFAVACALSVAALLTSCAGGGAGASSAETQAATSATAATTVTTATTGEPTVAGYPADGWCTDDDVFVRSGPSREYFSIGGLKRGEKVEVRGKDGDWYKIKFWDKDGQVIDAYVNAQYIQFNDQLPATTTLAETTAGTAAP